MQTPLAAPLTTALRLAGGLACLAIAVLSLVPGEARPHSGIPGLIEHAVAYAGTAALLTLGYHGRIRPLLIASPLVLYAAMLECGQIFVPTSWTLPRARRERSPGC
jgi:hypothetical protein